MANSNLRDIYLYDKFPGAVDFNLSVPVDGFDSTNGGHDVTEPLYEVGTKIAIYTDGTYAKGYSTLGYLKAVCISGKNDVDDLSSGFGIFGHCDVSIVGDTSEAPIFTVVNVAGASDVTTNGLLAFAAGCISSMDSTTADSGKYGWFWIGGTCPYVDITFFDAQSAGAGTDITTDGAVASGATIAGVVDTSQITLGLGDATGALISGLAVVADA